MLTFSTIEYTYSSVSSIKYFISFQGRIGVCLDPNASHGVVKNFVLFEQSKAAVVNENPAVLSAPNFVATNNRIAAGSAICQNRISVLITWRNNGNAKEKLCGVEKSWKQATFGLCIFLLCYRGEKTLNFVGNRAETHLICTPE